MQLLCLQTEIWQIHRSLGNGVVIIFKKNPSFAIFTLDVAYVHVGLHGFYEGFYHIFSNDFYNIKALLEHKGFSGVVIKLLLWLWFYVITTKKTTTYLEDKHIHAFAFKCTCWNTVYFKSEWHMDVRNRSAE